MEKNTERYELLKNKIRDEVFFRSKDHFIINKQGMMNDFVFDFKKIILQGDVIDAIASIFYDEYKHLGDDFQVGGMEVGAIPIISAIVYKFKNEGKSINGFFIRKSRKKDSLLSMIEGKLNDKKVILVDDLLNRGSVMMRQVELLKSLECNVYSIFVILRFRNIDYYEYLKENNIEIKEILFLEDLKEITKISKLANEEELPVPRPFVINWKFSSPKPNYYYVIPKSTPEVDKDKLYFGSDSGIMWAINQSDGTVAWNYKIGFGSRGKYIFSSPSVDEKAIYFGGYDGNFYALDKNTGKKKWIFMEADWIGSSPCVAQYLNTVFVGLEFGLINKKGGIVALDRDSGKKKWEYIMPGLTHSSPAYSKRYNTVVVGCNDFIVRAFNARNGELLWEFQTGGEVKESFTFDDKRGYVAFGSFDSNLYVLNIKNGNLVFKFETKGSIYSTPEIDEDSVYVSSLDKCLYSISLKTGEQNWMFYTAGRVFASPKVIGNKVLIGSNDGRLYELDKKTGKNTGVLQVTERITNKIAYNEAKETIFLPTFANEIYSINRRPKNIIV